MRKLACKPSERSVCCDIEGYEEQTEAWKKTQKNLVFQHRFAKRYVLLNKLYNCVLCEKSFNYLNCNWKKNR